ncbi:unnamed protein product [Diabrotica balteata]|uniref:Uncharacterized protein n=1 Tax=Diabrotica balteata TaxID=107213 RepID=A0A9N9SNP6_DIABA|nr:unnamed protein product [Diabrotica balteata]
MPSNEVRTVVQFGNEPGLSRGKKRKKNKSVWKRSKSKLERNSEKLYLNSRGRIVSEKQFFHGVCSCPRKCRLLLSLEKRKNIFQSFYNLSNFNLQTAYIQICQIVINKGRHTAAQNHNKRSKTQIHTLPKKIGDIVPVCKSFFKKALQVSDGRITRALISKSRGGELIIPPLDKR